MKLRLKKGLARMALCCKGTMESIEPPWQAIKEWILDDEPDLNWFNQERDPAGADPERFDQSPAWRSEEIPLGGGRTLVLDPT
jgi:hypothetical protein